MTEKALLFGRGKSLVGVLTEPGAKALPDAPALVLLNAGVLHRVGPNRLHVQLARALAEAGFASLRFDLSGVGDSRARKGARSFASAVEEDVRDALDLLQATTGADRFAAMGICSGADNALRVATVDHRIAGVVLVDGYNLATVGYGLQVYRERLLSPRSWGRLLLGQSEVWTGLQQAFAPGTWERATQARVSTALPAEGDYVAQVGALADRGTEVLLAYTGGSPAEFNYRRLLQHRVPRWGSRDKIRVVHFDDSDHVFTLRTNQRRLVALVTGWLENWTSGPADEDRRTDDRLVRSGGAL